MSRLDQWLAASGYSGIDVKELSYRPGAVLTVPLGLTEGYKVLPGGALDWGWARIHTGADRAGAHKGDVVLAPMLNDASAFIDYQGKGYGSLVRLISNEWCYEVRIAHLHPLADVQQDVLAALSSGLAIPPGNRIGRAGAYGVGEGRHTHTELVAWGDGAAMFLALLERLHGSLVHRDATEIEVLNVYRSLDHWREALDPDRFDDYRAQLKHRGLSFSNRYWHRLDRDPILGHPVVRISTWLALGM